MDAVTDQSSLGPGRSQETRRSIADVLSPLNGITAHLPGFVVGPVQRFEMDGEAYELPRFSFTGPQGGDVPIRVGLFAGIHGDEPEGTRAVVRFVQLLEASPEVAEGYALSLYPICNPTGFADGTRHSRRGKDLNREFWKDSSEPEVRWLEAELRTQNFDGIISLHTDEHSHGFYGFARGAILTKHLLRPALAATAQLLPVNADERIDGFDARDGLIEDCYEGVLSAPAEAHPKPFEIILEAPGLAPMHLREEALVIALRAVLAEYPKFISYGGDL
jgi:predicted deacylase